MMTGRLYIDGYDVYKTFGIYVTGDGWNDIVAMPPLKPVTFNDWQEEDGIEADLSEPVLNTREVTIKFAISGVYNRYFEFIEMLSDGAYHEFNCAYINRKYILRVISQPNLDYVKILGFAPIKFADDFPLKDYKYTPPMSAVIAVDDYKIDDKPLTDYGVRVLQGSLSEVLKMPNVKLNLLRNIKTVTGAQYDKKNVTYKSKDVKISCLIRANTLDELWRNYDALLFDMIRPEEHQLWVNDINKSFPCYYKSCSVSEFFPDDRWLKFTITLTFTSDFRIEEDDTVLASEDNIVIYTENGVYAIDMFLDKYSYSSTRFVNNKQTLRLTSKGNFRFNN